MNLVLVLAFLAWFRQPIFPRGKWILMVRGLSGFIGFVCYVYAVSQLPVSIAALLTWTSPVFVMVMGRVFLKEKITPALILAFAGAVGGLSLIVFPHDSTLAEKPLSVWALGIGLFGALAGAIAHVAVRSATKNFTSLIIILYYTFPGAVLAYPMAVSQGWVTPPRHLWPWLLALGLLGSVAQASITRAYAYLEAAPVSLMSLMGGLITVLFSAWFLDERLIFIQWLGIAILGLAVAFTIRNS